MNKVIFLDIDGVLNSTKSCEFYHKKYGGNGYGGFFKEDEEPTLENVLWDEECVHWLDKIAKETGASIVISSTWRKYYGLLAFHSMFKLYSVFDLDIVGKTKQKGFIGRGKEIQDYIDENNITNYVILDDDSDMLPSQMLNFVNTDCDLGLTKSDYLKAVKILGSVTKADAKHLLAVRVFNYEGRELKLKTPDFCPYGSNGFDDDCHCNNCINAITEMDGIKLGGVYFLKDVNMNVVITSICPLRSCVDFGWQRLPNATSGKLFGSCMLSDLTWLTPI